MSWPSIVTYRVNASVRRRSRVTEMEWWMRRACIGVTALVVVFTLGCAHGGPLHSIGSGAVPASRYVTFFTLPGNSSGNSDTDRQLNAEIEPELGDKGLVKTSPEEAEAVVVVHTGTSARPSRDVFYQGWGGWAWRIPGHGIAGRHRKLPGRIRGRRHL